MIRRILLASASVIAASGAVVAADLPSRQMAPMPYATPIFTWTGFYAGLNAGAAFTSTNSSVLRPSYLAGSGAAITTYNDYTTYGRNNNSTGFTGGGQIGYNWQASAFVFGIETDIQYRYTGGNTYGDGRPAVIPANTNYMYAIGSSRNSNYFGTVRGRLGYAVDRALFYVTGGFAYGGKQGGVTAYYNNAGAAGGGAAATYPYIGSSSKSGVGYTLGGGVEYAITNNWTIKGEYLYVDLGKKSGALYTATASTAGNGLPTVINTGAKGDRFSVARAGVNYKF